MAGPVALVGGGEFLPGNEEQDRALAGAAGGGPAFVLPTAAARQGPAQAVANAQRWFGALGLTLGDLPVLTPGDARSERLAAMAREGRFFYLVGGDPGLVVSVLQDSPVWAAIAAAWRAGAALAGSSAGAMALGQWTLLRERWPNPARRRYADALGLVRGIAVVPHYATGGHRWLDSAQAAAPTSDVVLLGVDERTAAFWDGATWTVRGPGEVTVIRGSDIRSYAAGEVIAGLFPPIES